MKGFSDRFILFLLVADIISTVLALVLAEVLREALPLGRINMGMSFLDAYIVAAVAIIWAFFLRFFGAYDPRRLSSFVDEGRAVILAILAGMVLLASFFYMFNIEYRSRMLFAYFAGIDLVLLLNYRLITRYVVRTMIAGGYNVRRVLLVGATKVGKELAYITGNQPWAGLSVVGFVDDDPILRGLLVDGAPVLGTTAELPRS